MSSPPATSTSWTPSSANFPARASPSSQPSPYDDVTRPANFEGGYNQVLVRYGDFLKQLAAEQKLGLADINTPVVDALKKANAADAPNAAKILPDRVHPERCRTPAPRRVPAQSLECARPRLRRGDRHRAQGSHPPAQHPRRRPARGQSHRLDPDRRSAPHAPGPPRSAGGPRPAIVGFHGSAQSGTAHRTRPRQPADTR